MGAHGGGVRSYIGPIALVLLGALLIAAAILTFFAALALDAAGVLKLGFVVFAGVCVILYGLRGFRNS